MKIDKKFNHFLNYIEELKKQNKLILENIICKNLTILSQQYNFFSKDKLGRMIDEIYANLVKYELKDLIDMENNLNECPLCGEYLKKYDNIKTENKEIRKELKSKYPDFYFEISKLEKKNVNLIGCLFSVEIILMDKDSYSSKEGYIELLNRVNNRLKMQEPDGILSGKNFEIENCPHCFKEKIHISISIVDENKDIIGL